MNNSGTLYLIPTPLGDSGLFSMLSYNQDVVKGIGIFIAERIRTSRRFLKQWIPDIDIGLLEFFELGKYTSPEEKNAYILPLLEGKDIGLMSEAGCPGIADPGAEIVQIAHEHNIKVVPLVGPNSIMLALMASGLNGQKFCFNGYLSPKRNVLEKEIRQLEQLSKKTNTSMICMETPYRNNAFLETALNSLKENTRLCIATDVTLPSEFIKTKSIGSWKKLTLPDLHKRPAIFILLSN